VKQSRKTYIAQTDVLDERRVQLGLLHYLLQQSVDHVVQFGVLEAALGGLGKRRPQRKGDDNVIRVLLGAGVGQYVMIRSWARDGAYIAETPLPPEGRRWFRRELRRSAAIVTVILGVVSVS
jgi:hypothetical protein